MDRAVVVEERVGKGSEAHSCLLAINGDRLIGEVPAGHHERAPEVRGQEVVEGRVGERITPSQRLPGASPLATGAPVRRRAITIGRAGDSSSSLRSRAAQPHDALGLGGHDRQRPGFAALALTQPLDRCFACRVTGEVVAAEPLDREDPPSRGIATASARSSPSCGPQSGQQIVSAWWRRSVRSSYSARRRAHIANPAIVVFERS